MNVVAKVTSADYTITEGETQAFSVTLDKPAAADTTLTVRVGEQTAFLADYGIKLFSGYILGDKQATFYFGSQADKDDALSRGPEIDKLMFDRYGMTREDLQKFPVGIENAVQDFRILDASGKEIQIGSDGTFTVDVKAGATTSEAFSVQALYDMQMTYSHSAPDAQEGAETFTFTVAGSNDTQCIESPSTQVTIENFALRHTPVALDLNGDGQINVTGASTSYEYAGEIGKTVQFDINGDGKADSIEWLDGSGDGLLVDNRDGNAAGDMNGGRLFGDQVVRSPMATRSWHRSIPTVTISSPERSWKGLASGLITVMRWFRMASCVRFRIWGSSRSRPISIWLLTGLVIA